MKAELECESRRLVIPLSDKCSLVSDGIHLELLVQTKPVSFLLY